MIIKITYLAEKILNKQHVSEIPFASIDMIDIFHLSTMDHLIIFLESIFTRFPKLKVNIFSHFDENIINDKLRQYQEFHDQRIVINNRRKINKSSKKNASVLLHSSKSSILIKNKIALKLHFILNRNKMKYLITGDGQVFRADLSSQIIIKLCYFILKYLAPIRDKLEMEIIRNRLVFYDFNTNNCIQTKLISQYPIEITQCLQTGSIIKTGLINGKIDDSIYDGNYHHSEFYDEFKNWDNLLNKYQEIRWRNMQNVGIQFETEKKLTALDIGCGTGGLADKLSIEGFDTLGIDCSKTAIDKALLSFPNMKFKVCDIDELIKNKYKFDLITLSHVLEHFRDDVDMLRKIALLMKASSKIYIEVPLFYEGIFEKRPFWYRQIDHFREYSKEGLKKVMEDAGFEVIIHKDGLNDYGNEPYQFLSAKLK